MEIKTAGNIAILKVNGEITIKNIDQFQEMMRGFINSDTNAFMLDLSNVSYLNSSALGQIADGVIKLKKVNKELIIAGIQPNIAEIFEIVKFDSFIKLFTEIESGIAYFNNNK